MITNRASIKNNAGLLSFLLFFSVAKSQPFSLGDTTVRIGQFQHFYDIRFELASEKLQTSDQKQLDSLLKFLNRNPNIKIELGVHTDSRGDDKMNLDLSKQRAATLKTFLVENGIRPERIKAIGFGETKPVVEYEDWQKTGDTHRCGYYGRGNRRVTVVISSFL